MPPANVRHALESALRGSAGPEEWSQICADAALRAGAHSSMIEAMVASFKPDALQQRLDDLVPKAKTLPSGFLAPDYLPPGVVLAKDLAKEYDISPQTIRDMVKDGRVTEVGRVGGKGSGKDGFLAVFRSEVDYARTHPRKRGRKRKIDMPCA